MDNSLPKVISPISLPGEWLVVAPGSMLGASFVNMVGTKTDLWGAGIGYDSRSPYIHNFQELDITNSEQALKVLQSFPGKYILSFAAATSVDEIEKTRPADPDDIELLEQNIAYRINVLGSKNLAQACEQTGKVYISFGTDFAWDGRNGPYCEDDQMSSSAGNVSWYGWIKFLGVKEILCSGSEYIILNISYPYLADSEVKGDIVRNYLKLFDDVEAGIKPTLYPAFEDLVFTPTRGNDIAPALALLVERGARGIYNIASPVSTNFYEFNCEILRVARGVANPEELIKRGSAREYMKAHPEWAKRPIHGGLRTAKIEALGFTPTAWQNGLEIDFKR